MSALMSRFLAALFFMVTSMDTYNHKISLAVFARIHIA